MSDDGLLTARQAAKHVGLSLSGFYRALRRLRVVRRAGHDMRFTRAELDRWFAVRRTGTVVDFRAGEEWLKGA